MIRTAILGASGYVGGELLRLLAAHPQLARDEAVRRQQGRPGRSAPFIRILRPLISDAIDREVRRGRARRRRSHLRRISAWAQPAARGEQSSTSGIPFVDLGADFRLDDAATYERWYGHAHEAPDLLGQFVYGIPELNREAIRGAKAVAAAGCYATAAILALKPLVDAGLVDAGSLIVDAASGVSGAGREAKESTGFNTVDGSFAAYGLLNHRHTAEMEMALGAHRPVHAAPRADDARHPRDLLRERAGPVRSAGGAQAAYDAEPFVHVTDQPPATKWVSGSNGAQLTARYDERTGRVVSLCRRSTISAKARRGR